MDPIYFDAYVIDVLMPDLIGHDHQPSAFVVYLRLWRLTAGGQKPSVPTSLRALAEQTVLSKRTIQEAVSTLERRRLIQIERAMPTAVPAYRVLRPWRISLPEGYLRRKNGGATNRIRVMVEHRTDGPLRSAMCSIRTRPRPQRTRPPRRSSATTKVRR